LSARATNVAGTVTPIPFLDFRATGDKWQIVHG
jgi:hypothetical protein